ncbi:MAG: N-acetyl-gamma-glutamyl-phosphate reductase [Oscillospiraceae bacterium]
MKKVFIDGSQGTTGLKIFDRLSKRTDIQLIKLPEDKRKDINARKIALNSADIAFLCLPDAAAIEAVSLIENDNTIVIDTSTAHRTDKGWAYGFPELSDDLMNEIKSSKRIAVPGCHASGFISLVRPLVEKGFIKKETALCCHSITGYSGGGKKMIAEYEAEERSELLSSPRQYGLLQNHKHLKEMVAISGISTAPIFCPIVADYFSGMLVTVPLFKKDLIGKKTIEDIKALYKSIYSSNIVTYCDDFCEDGFMASNKKSELDNMEITVSGNDERILLVSRYDNLGKGASGAALECMNIVMGLEPGYNLELN